MPSFARPKARRGLAQALTRLGVCLPFLGALLCPPAGPVAAAPPVAPVGAPAREAVETATVAARYTAQREAALERSRASWTALEALPKASEFLRGDHAGVRPHNGRIRLTNLDLSRAPTEKELRQAGELGSPLTPSGSADTDKLADSQQKRRQLADNLLLGRAIQKWNEHHYDEAAKLFREHRQTFARSPWAGEAELHLGCQAQFSGSWESAKFSFEWVLNNHQKGEAIYQKTKLRRAVLHIDQGELKEAVATFREMLDTETDWERRTYAAHWIQQLSLYQGHEVALRDCGAQSIAFILEKQGHAAEAQRARAATATGEKGYSLGELRELARRSGLDSAAAVRLEPASLRVLSTPFVAHYRDRHFVVVDGMDENGSVKVFDPRLKRETRLTIEEFTGQWSSLALIFAEVPAGAQLASALEQSENYGGCCGLPRNENNLGPKNDKPCCTCRGMPAWEINPVNLNLVMEDTPLWFDEPVGPNVEMHIAYNSQDALNQLRPFGNKWTFDYTSYALESPAQGGPGMVLVVMPGGRRDNYQPDGAGGYTAPAGSFNVLTKTDTYAFRLQLPDGTVYQYGVPAGMTGNTSLLLSIADRNNVAVNIRYLANGNIDKIQDIQNRSWTFSYNTSGLVSRIDDPFGRYATFTYDAGGNLVGQVDMGGNHYGYTYDANVYVTSLIKPLGTTLFYVEPADGKVSNEYPASGGNMWENYRITITDALGFKEEYYYNGYSRYGWYRDKIQTQKPGSPPSLPKTRFDYAVVSGQGVVSTTTLADNSTAVLGNFDSNRNPQSVQDENGHVHTYTYNAQGKVLTHTDARGHTTSYRYAANGFDLVEIVNDNHVSVTKLEYDARRNVLSMTDVLNRKQSMTYNSVGQVETTTNPANQTRSFVYNALNQLIKVTQSGNTLQTLSYDSLGRVAANTYQNGFTLGYTYDNLGRTLRTRYPDGTFSENQWGCCVLEGQTDRLGRATNFFYDALKRKLLERDALGSMVICDYDPVGNLVGLRDGNGSYTIWQYDAKYRLTNKILADGSKYTFTYDSCGNLLTKTDADGRTVTFAYDEANNLTGTSAPGTPSVTFAFDNLNRPTQIVDGQGTTILGYDDAGRNISITGPRTGDSITYSYDVLGRTTSASIDGSPRTMDYDEYGRVIKQTNVLGMFTYTYPGAVSTLLTSVSLPNGQSTSFTYNTQAGGDWRLSEIWHKTGAGNAQTLSRFNYTYDASGQVSTWRQQVGNTATSLHELSYNLSGELTAAVRRDATSGNVLNNSAYVYDQAGNRTTFLKDGVLSENVLNALNELISTRGGGGTLPIRGQTDEPAQSVKINGVAARMGPNGITFDGGIPASTGNNPVTVQATDLNGNVSTKRYNVALTSGNGASYIYDASGNLLSDGTRTYEWNALGQLSAINYVGTNRRSEFAYDGLGRRVVFQEKNGTSITNEKRFVWMGANLAEERDGNNNVVRRFFGQGEQIAGQNYYYACDHLGSVREMTDNTQAVRAEYDYDLYGLRSANLVSANALESTFGFTGHYLDSSSGLYLAPYRAYDANSGRWLSRDPLAEQGGLNLYEYAGNNPAGGVDPLGLKRWIVYSGPHPAMVFQETVATAGGVQLTGRLLFTEFGPGATNSIHEIANNFMNEKPSDANLIQASLYETTYTASMAALLRLNWGLLAMGLPNFFENVSDHPPADWSIYIPSTPEEDNILQRALQLELCDPFQPYSLLFYNSIDWMNDHMYIGRPNHSHVKSLNIDPAKFNASRP